MKAQLALALLAVGPLKTASGKERVDKPNLDTKAARDPIAFLAREWLAKR